MKKTFKILLLTIFVSCLLFAGNAYREVNRSTVYKVEIYEDSNTAELVGALYTTTLNNLQVVTKHCVTGHTRIFLNDKPAKLSELRRGYKVVVDFRDDKCKTASVIKAYK